MKVLTVSNGAVIVHVVLPSYISEKVYVNGWT